ncbi:F5/8_type C domain-containing protein [Hexamita inflata]|uniref:F5/8 type C domain-containing protein n=1 Tax=Hexamita inflata TaxID=28002 RepID=A0AA86VCB1_9EUKA|nr:F5/8 type C domain-containing protein [Hexamita inflata]
MSENIQSFQNTTTETVIQQQYNDHALSKTFPIVMRTVSDCYANKEQEYGACQSHLDGKKCWCPYNQQKICGQYLEFDFCGLVHVGFIITQGKKDCCWVTKYKVEYYVGEQWYQGGEYEGNVDSNTKEFRKTNNIANKLRIFPLAYHEYIDFKADVAIVYVDQNKDVLELSVNNQQFQTENNLQNIQTYNLPEDNHIWHYLDTDNIFKGPFTTYQMDYMNKEKYFQIIGVTKVKCQELEVKMSKQDYGMIEFFQQQRKAQVDRKMIESDSGNNMRNMIDTTEENKSNQINQKQQQIDQNQIEQDTQFHNNQQQSDPNIESKQNMQEYNQEESLDQIYSDSDMSVVNKEMGDFRNSITQTGMNLIQLDLVLSQEIKDVQKQDCWSQYEIINTDLLKDVKNGIQYERTLSHAETQTDLSKLEISITQTRQCFQKLVIPPSVEKCINTELSLRRGNQDEEYIENKFTTYRDVQAVEVGDHTGARVPIVKKEQHGNKESIFAPGAGLLQHNDNPDLDPVAYKEQLKAKQHDLYYDHFNDYDFGDIPYSHWNEDNDNQNYQQPNNNNDNQEPAQNNYQEQNVNYQQPEPEPNKQFIAQDLFPNVFKNINSQNDNQTGKENIMDTRTGTEQNIPREVQKAQSQFKELILKAINDHFQNEGRNDLKTDSLRQALINYRQYYAEVKRIHLDFRKIAAQLGLTEKQVSQMFRTLQDNELDDWSPEKIQAVRERAEQLRLTHPELSKEQLKEQLDKEFSLTPEYSQSPKKITNRISYILKKLFG